MKRCWMTGLALAMVCVASTRAYARPPTVQTSPGYDRRLQESRSQLGSSPTVTAPADVPVAKPKHGKKKHKS
ncbi:hypothetical protein QRQ56_30325 [Bradyrhizobium sp. U531]|uniref:hypothetical protein n=1 Tax=Bradyrhizobium sp. U531 TaxID=3053458 RepID=UPI003F43205A